ncbi:MAG: glycosyltransferase family 2 protein [Comamonadaceae bacterium]|nr:MAG: glycosyltransferase family 2 protein [Comamonadaceae bacterium]
MISVVIPLYNKEGTIERAVKSVLEQSASDFELIVVDDGSSDRGPVLVRRLEDPRIRIVTQANAGVSAARNSGVAQASCDIVAFVDADDYWDPAHLANLAALVKRFPEASVFATAYFVVGEGGQIRKIRLRGVSAVSRAIRESNYFHDATKGDPPLCSSSVAVRKSALSQVGGFPLGIEAGEDILTWARLACTGKVVYSNHATAYYVLPPVSVERNRNAIRRPPKHDFVGDELEKLSVFENASGSSFRRYVGNWYRIRAMLFMELNERRNCIAELGRAIGKSGIHLRDLVTLGLLLLPAKWRARLVSRWRQRHDLHPDTAS